ncbi:MAG: VanZ family protein [Sumerlaeia bacterium]
MVQPFSAVRPVPLVLAFLWAGAVLLVNSRPSSGLPDISWWMIPGLDKVIHFCMYGGLAFWLWKALVPDRKTFVPAVPYARLIVVLVPALLAVADEWNQGYVPGRSPDFWDLCFDFAGIAAVVILGTMTRNSIHRSSSRLTWRH